MGAGGPLVSNAGGEVRQWLYVVEPASTSVRCRACGAQVERRQPRVIFRRVGQRQLTSCHLVCVGGIEGLVRPSVSSIQGGGEKIIDLSDGPPLAGSTGSPTDAVADCDQYVGGEAFLSPLLSDEERVVALDNLAALGTGLSSVQCFEWPPRPRPVARRMSSLQQQLQYTD